MQMGAKGGHILKILGWKIEIGNAKIQPCLSELVVGIP